MRRNFNSDGKSLAMNDFEICFSVLFNILLNSLRSQAHLIVSLIINI
jgi:hypothetical protein